MFTLIDIFQIHTVFSFEGKKRKSKREKIYVNIKKNRDVLKYKK
jgi:hypothetical protein